MPRTVTPKDAVPPAVAERTFGPAASLDAWTGFFVLMLAPEGFLPLRQLAQAYHERSAALAASA